MTVILCSPLLLYCIEFRLQKIFFSYQFPFKVKYSFYNNISIYNIYFVRNIRLRFIKWNGELLNDRIAQKTLHKWVVGFWIEQNAHIYKQQIFRIRTQNIVQYHMYHIYTYSRKSRLLGRLLWRHTLLYSVRCQSLQTVCFKCITTYVCVRVRKSQLSFLTAHPMHETKTNTNKTFLYTHFSYICKTLVQSIHKTPQIV